jgi:hypothetical protein
VSPAPARGVTVVDGQDLLAELVEQPGAQGVILVDPLADGFDLSRVSCGVMAQLIAYEPWGVTIDPVPGAALTTTMRSPTR